MKPINRYRQTDMFCICSSSIRHLTIIQKAFGDEIIAVARTCPEDANRFEAMKGYFYTVRLSKSDVGLRDAIVRVCGNEAKIVDIHVLCDWTKKEIA